MLFQYYTGLAGNCYHLHFISSAPEEEALAPLWKYLSFTQNIGLNIREHGTFSHARSVCIEEQF